MAVLSPRPSPAALPLPAFAVCVTVVIEHETLCSASRKTPSDLYQLNSADWKGRAPYEFAQPVFSVENTEDKWYMGKVRYSRVDACMHALPSNNILDVNWYQYSFCADLGNRGEHVYPHHLSTVSTEIWKPTNTSSLSTVVSRVSCRMGRIQIRTHGLHSTLLSASTLPPRPIPENSVDTHLRSSASSSP